MKFKKINPLVVSLAILALSLVFMFGFCTNWGNVRVSRNTMLSENGHEYSYVSFVQKSSSDENPGPAVVLYHGNNESAQAFGSWAVEIIRRGYNVFMLDLPGSGFSDPEFSDDYKIATEFIKYVQNLPFIDYDKVLSAGHSKGASFTGYMVDQTDIAGGVAVSGMRFQKTWGDTFEGNMITIIGEGDWMNRLYDMQPMNQKFMQKVYGTDGSLPEFGKEYGSVEDRNFRILYSFDGLFAQHCAARWSPRVIGMVCDSLMKIVPTGSDLTGKNLVIGWHYFFSLTAMLSLVSSILCIIIALSKLPFFKSSMQEMRPCIGRTGRRWWKSALLSAIPTVPIFILINYIAVQYLHMDKATKLFPVATTNRFIPFYLILGLFEIFLFSFTFYRKEKYTLSECGLIWQSSASENWKNIGKTALLASLGAGLGLTFLYIMEVGFGMTFQALFVQMRGVSLNRVMKCLLYLPIFLVLFTGMNLGGNISRRLKSTGHEYRDMARDIVVNCLVGNLLLSIYFFINMWCNDHSLFWDVVDSVGHTYYLYNFMLLGNVAGAANTVLYRKTGTIWTGVFFCTFFLGVIIPGLSPII